MKLLACLPAALLLATACRHHDPAPADPFLGHWQGESMHLYAFVRGQQPLKDTIIYGSFTLDVGPDTIQHDYVGYGQRYRYTRNGEVLTTPYTPELSYVRNLTPESFR